MKDTFYFPHDYHARHDPKLERLRMKYGCVTDGVYWCLVEMMYEQGGYISIEDAHLYSKLLNTDIKIIEDLSEFQEGVVSEEINLEDTVSVLSNYIDSVETDMDKDKVKTFMKTLYLEALHMDHNS